MSEQLELELETEVGTAIDTSLDNENLDNANGEVEVAEVKDVKKDLSDDEVLEFLKAKGFTDLNSIEELKPKVVPSETDLIAQKTEKENKLLQIFLKKNPTSNVQEFVNLTSIANEDPSKLAEFIQLNELIQLGLSKEDAQAQIDKHNGFISEEDMEFLEEEQKEVYKKVNGYLGKTKALIGEREQLKAKSIISELEKEIQDQIEEEIIDAQISQTVKDASIAYNKNIEIELNKASTAYDLPNFVFQTPDSILEKVKNELANKKTREALLFNENGVEKVDLIYKLRVLEETFDLAVKAAADHAQKHQFDYFNSKMPLNPKSLIPQQQERANAQNQVGKIVPNSGKLKN